MIFLAVVLCIIGTFFFVFGLICLFTSYDGSEALMSLLFIYLGAVLFAGGFAAGSSYDEQTHRLCESKGGHVLEKSAQCVKDGKIIEFSPGVWER